MEGSFTWLAIGLQTHQGLTRCSTTSAGSQDNYDDGNDNHHGVCEGDGVEDDNDDGDGGEKLLNGRTSEEGGKQIVLFPEGTNFTAKVISSSSSSSSSLPFPLS